MPTNVPPTEIRRIGHFLRNQTIYLGGDRFGVTADSGALVS